jgi:hypothetical protein
MVTKLAVQRGVHEHNTPTDSHEGAVAPRPHVTVVTWFAATDACNRRCGSESGNATLPRHQAAEEAVDAVSVGALHPCVCSHTPSPAAPHVAV